MAKFIEFKRKNDSGEECYVMVQGSYDDVIAKIREAVGDVSDMPEESVC
jgi:hypothetical protein